MAHIEQHCTTLHNILLPNQFDSIMPHVLQPGGLSRTMRVRYTARRKLGLPASVKRIMEEEGGLYDRRPNNSTFRIHFL